MAGNQYRPSGTEARRPGSPAGAAARPAPSAGQAAGMDAEARRAVKDFTCEQVTKALALIAERRITKTRPGAYLVVASDGKTIYITRAGGCTCPAGGRGHRCYHSAAARLLNVAKRWGLAA